MIKSWAFKRPYCTPEAGFVIAVTSGEAIKLIHYAYGFASGTEVYCALTGEKKVDEND